MKKTQITKATCCGRTIRYALLTSIGEDGTRRYGAAVFCAGKEEAVIDITGSKAKALALIAKLRRGRVTPVALRDIVDDWLLL